MRLSNPEKQLCHQGYKLIAGVDEAGPMAAVMPMSKIFEYFPMQISFKRLGINVGIYKDKTKTKKDILLLHGLGSNGYEFYEEIEEDIPSKRLCAIDWIGHGQTTKLLKEEDTYDAKYMADYLSIVIDNLIKNGILKDRFFIIAKSMSAIPLGYLCDSYKNNFEKIILITPAGFDKKMGYIFAFFSSVITRSIILSWFFSYWILYNKKRRILQKNLRIKNWGKIISRYARSGYDIFGNMKSTHIVSNRFKSIDKDILLVCGEKDFIFPKRNYLNFALENKWGITILPNEGHTFKKENFRKSAEIMRKFIGIE